MPEVSQSDEESKKRARVGGRYDLLHELASGGMATVHVARSRGAAGFGRLVAIKRCHPHLHADEEFARMFLDEARLVAELRHPNVVATLDFGEDEALSLFIVMEYVDGFSLQQLSRMAKGKGARMPASVALRVMIDTLQGLQAAHDHTDAKGNPLNIIHRDVSPQNILLGVDGVARIMDFGIARAESRLSHTRDGNIKGKAAYMAPEQHGLLSDNPPPMTHRADLYSAGVVLWELLSGKQLFQRENDAKTLAAAMRGTYTPASEIDPTLPAQLDVVIATALSVDPSARFATATAFIDAIEACGLVAASSREVTRWVREVAQAQIEQRQNALRKFADDAPDDADAVIDRVLTTATNARMRAEIERTGTVPASAAGDVLEINVQSLVPNEPIAPPPVTRTESKPTRRTIAVVAAVAILVGVAVAYSRSTATAITAGVEQQRISSQREDASTAAIVDAVAATPEAQHEPSPTATQANLAHAATEPDAGAAHNGHSAADPTRRPPPVDGVRPRPTRVHDTTFRPRFL